MEDYEAVESKKKILKQIDSTFNNNTLKCDRFKKVIHSRCINDSVLEVKVKTWCDDYKLFYFDKKLNVVKVVNIMLET